MHVVFAVDPSVRSPGAALFVDTRLVRAGRVKLVVKTYLSEGERWQHVADQLDDWLGTAVPSLIVYERPQVYAASKSKGDPNDLVPLAAIGAAVVAMQCARRRINYPEIMTPTPAEWIGQLPKMTRGKALASPRAIRIMSRLSEAEKALVPDQHDAIDAVGLGLHALGRLGVRRVFTSERQAR